MDSATPAEPTGDPFTLLNVDPAPWMDDADLQARYDELSRRLHPDRAGGSEAEFARAQAAFTTLRDPVSRLRALLARVGELPAARTGTVPEPMVELFMEIGELLPAADGQLAALENATSPLTRALAAPKVVALRTRVEKVLAQVESALEMALEELRDLNAQEWKAPTGLATLRRLYQSLAFLSRWRTQLQERAAALVHAL